MQTRRIQNHSVFQHISRHVLNEAVGVLFCEKIVEIAPRKREVAHAVHKLNDGRTFRTDGTVNARGGREHAVLFPSVTAFQKVQISRLDAFVDEFFGRCHRESDPRALSQYADAARSLISKSEGE